MKALELAERLENPDEYDDAAIDGAATELRRLAEVNAALLKALEYWVPVTEPLQHQHDIHCTGHREKWRTTTALIAKAKEQQ